MHFDTEDRFGTLHWNDSWGHWLGGGVIVVRQDKRALTVRQVEAMASFSHEFIIAINEKREKMGGPTGTVGEDRVEERGKVMRECLTRGRFEQVFFALKFRNTEEGNIGWVNEVSPYEDNVEPQK
jgi:hypothetical protein